MLIAGCDLTRRSIYRALEKLASLCLVKPLDRQVSHFADMACGLIAYKKISHVSCVCGGLENFTYRRRCRSQCSRPLFYRYRIIPIEHSTRDATL